MTVIITREDILTGRETKRIEATIPDLYLMKKNYSLDAGNKFVLSVYFISNLLDRIDGNIRYEIKRKIEIYNETEHRYREIFTYIPN